jgi:hypothetical protein
MKSLNKKKSIRYRLQLRLAALASHGALNEAVGIGLRSQNRGVLAQVLDVLMP